MKPAAWVVMLAVCAFAPPGRGEEPRSGPWVLVRKGVVSRRPAVAVGAPVVHPTISENCGVEARAWHNQPVPGGGTLDPVAFAFEANINSSGTIAFASAVEGAERNQGIFRATPQGLEAVVMGCGGGGGSGDPGSGCGDPSPIGGTFSGLFWGTSLAPAINDAGDLLFLADVHNGSSPRGLFFYRAATRTIVKVAAVGDPIPTGGAFGALGPGTLNSTGTVVFLAIVHGRTDADYFRWEAGVVSKLASVGDPAPGGGVFQLLGSERLGSIDGTTIPLGPMPDVNDSGQVAFRAWVQGGQAARGLFVSTGGVHRWYVASGDPAPAGGTFWNFDAPILNNNGQIAFFGDAILGQGYVAGWYVGAPGQWRRALAQLDTVEGRPVWGMAVSRNPMTPLDDRGNLLIWCTLGQPDESEEERLFLSTAEGALVSLAQQGDPSPLGGRLGILLPWPSINGLGEAELGAATRDAPGGIFNAHLIVSRCGHFLGAQDVAVTEGNSGTATASLTVRLSRSSSLPVTVDYLTTDGSAREDSDYQPAAGSITLPPGTTEATIPIAVSGDTLQEATESFSLILGDVRNAELGDARGTASILDDDPGLSAASVSDVALVEGNTGDRSAAFAVTLSKPSIAQTVTIPYATADGTATVGLDYTGTSGTLTFSSGQTTRTVTVAVRGDTAAEDNEHFSLLLGTPTHATVVDGKGVATILDDEGTRFYAIAPCRIADTRTPPGPAGGPALRANRARVFPVASLCGIPADARAVALNLTVVGPTDAGNLRLYPADVPPATVSAINFVPDRVRANNAIAPLGTEGRLAVQCDMAPGSVGTTHALIDAYGYFK